MNQFKSISIVGGGLAGLTLGIALRQRSIPVAIFEAGKYPRHRVCGEFVSGRGQQTLERLGLVDCVMKAGARLASTAAFQFGERSFSIRRLPREAWCLSRYTLDALLVDRFCKLGGELHCETRWKETFQSPGVVRATGRRSQSIESGWRWFGLKAHACRVRMCADLEMHLLPNAYIGLCRLTGDRVNICGLFRSRRGESEEAPPVIERLRNGSSRLREQMEMAEWVSESVCAVAGLSLRPRLDRETNECRIGDALTMIAPVTGNGMSMAFESAELAIEPLVAYAGGKIEWSEVVASIARRSDARFSRRLRWAWRLQGWLFTPAIRRTIVPAVMRIEPAWRFLFDFTR